MKTPAIAMSKSARAQAALDAFSSSYLGFQYPPADYPHLRENGTGHAHLLVIDNLHCSWPKGT